MYLKKLEEISYPTENPYGLYNKMPSEYPYGMGDTVRGAHGMGVESELKFPAEGYIIGSIAIKVLFYYIIYDQRNKMTFWIEPDELICDHRIILVERLRKGDY